MSWWCAVCDIDNISTCIRDTLKCIQCMSIRTATALWEQHKNNLGQHAKPAWLQRDTVVMRRR